MFSNKTVFISDRAYADMLGETSQHLSTETGGVFLGFKKDPDWYVIESIDPGPRAIRSYSYFEYDHPYVNHLANKISLRYATPLSLLGLWHRHPGSLDQFSSTDDGTHIRYINQCRGPIISCLVNIDPHFRLTPYLAHGSPPRYEKIGYEVGDRYFDANHLVGRLPSAILETISAKAGSRSRNGSTHQTITVSGETLVGTGDSRPSLLKRSIDAFTGWSSSTSTEPAIEQSARILNDAQTTALEMLDEELAYLASQDETAYDLELVDVGIRLTLHAIRASSGHAAARTLVLTRHNERPVVTASGNVYDFRTGIVSELTTTLFA